MHKLALLFLLASPMWAQTPKTPADITVCWSAPGDSQLCSTVASGHVAIITIDGRMQPVQAVVVQPIPDYQIATMQSFVNSQTGMREQADGSQVAWTRYGSVQDWIMQSLIDQIIKLFGWFPPADPTKNSKTVATADAKVLTQVFPRITIP